jgi:hypothetical protein
VSIDLVAYLSFDGQYEDEGGSVRDVSTLRRCLARYPDPGIPYSSANSFQIMPHH